MNKQEIGFRSKRVTVMPLAEAKDEYFNSLSDDDFKRLLLYNGLVDERYNPTEWSISQRLFWGYSGVFTHDKFTKVEPDRFSSDDSLTIISTRGIKYIKSIVKANDGHFTFRHIMDGEMQS